MCNNILPPKEEVQSLKNVIKNWEEIIRNSTNEEFIELIKNKIKHHKEKINELYEKEPDKFI